MRGSIFDEVDSKTHEETRMHTFVLFKDLDFKRFTDQLKEKIESLYGMDFEAYVASLPRTLPEELKRDKEVMIKFKPLRVPDRGGLLEERYISYLIWNLTMSLTTTALKMTESGRRLIQKELEGKPYPGPAFFAGTDFLSMHYLNEESEELREYREKCSKITITKEDVKRLGKALSVWSPHKTGWLEEEK